MPELPEVETVVNILEPQLKNKIIKNVKVYFPKILKTHSDLEIIKELKNKKIFTITRIAKHIIFDLGDIVLISHLRMEGKYYLSNSYDGINKKHILIEFQLDDGQMLLYHDTRRFGTFHLIDKNKYLNVRPINTLGKEAWTITAKELYDKIHNRKRHIKTLLLDQTLISGLGNIYVDEVLFWSKIHPEEIGNTISLKNCEKIVESSKKVLTKAVRLGGTTISSYTSSLGVSGKFQNELMVHTMKDKLCKLCSTKILKTKVGGRGTYYCSKCQKLNI